MNKHLLFITSFLLIYCVPSELPIISYNSKPLFVVVTRPSVACSNFFYLTTFLGIVYFMRMHVSYQLTALIVSCSFSLGDDAIDEI